jgi:hypothetical protein
VKWYERFLELQPNDPLKIEVLKNARSKMLSKNEKITTLIDVLSDA